VTRRSTSVGRGLAGSSISRGEGPGAVCVDSLKRGRRWSIEFRHARQLRMITFLGLTHLAQAHPMTTSSIEHLYKFRSLATPELRQRVKPIFSNAEIHFSRRKHFNDPFDCLPTVSTDFTKAELFAYLEDLSAIEKPALDARIRTQLNRESTNDFFNGKRRDEIIGNLRRRIETTADEPGIFSMAREVDHVLMWSHYADSHRGICLRFKATDTTPFFGLAQKVEYQADRPALNLVCDPPDVIFKKALLTKADFWGYENEYRILDPFKGPGVQTFPHELLDGVYLGANIEPEDRSLVRQWVKDHASQAEVYEASFHPDMFALKFERIE